jgi:hypothetical protein
MPAAKVYFYGHNFLVMAPLFIQEVIGFSSIPDPHLGSLYAVIGFFAGGLLMTHVLFPLIFP